MSLPSQAGADPVASPYLDLPISQSINRDGTIRYAVWIKVGDRTVQAMIDTGSTGLRVLQSVMPRDVVGEPTDMAFGAGLHMQGVAIKAPIEVGSRTGVATVEVVDRISCVEEKPNCDVTNLSGDSYLIGGNGYPSEGYSAILGIGFPFRGTDIGSPLAALGVKSWIVDLPRPDESADGHLILDPDAGRTRAFAMLDRHGMADAAGCIEAGPLHEKKCGTLLFDTGAPGINVSFEGIETAARWEDGTAGVLTFVSDDQTFTLDFRVGQNGGLTGAGVTPPGPHDPAEPFILAGATPYFAYDVLYDDRKHRVGLLKRAPPSMPPATDAADSSFSAQ